jgi:choline monooxygenase
MNFEHLRSEILRFDPGVPVERAWMPPASWYVDPDFYALERETVFARSWQLVARVAELPGPGAYISGVLAGEPWVVVRQDDGELAAFANVCRHKGREVVQGSGCASELVCGYHAWCYTLAGDLKSAPKIAGILDFDRKQMGLVPLGVETWGPWVFINGDRNAAPLSARVATLDQRLELGGWQDLTFVGRRSWVLNCNWKVYIDNYLDGGYHIPHMHPTLDAQLDMQNYGTELFDECSIQGSPASTAGDQRIAFDAEARIGDGALYAWIHPNLMLNRYGSCLDSNHVRPLGPHRCEVAYEFYFAETVGKEAQQFIDESMQQSDVTQQEDIAICESVQVGLGSRAFDRGRYAPGLELGEHHFHGLLARDFRTALRE